MRFGSVCSGIEAASVAWEPLGWRAAWFSEIEPFPSAVLAHHYPQVPNLGDMTALPERIRSGEVEAPDVLAGGTPCQAFSVAGNRRSLADARGNLSLTFCEIANAIDHVRTAAGQQPAIVFWENVGGVLSTKDNAFGCFLGELAGESCQLEPPGGRWANAGVVHGPTRTIAWRVFDAQYFGVAQRRRRVFVVASARNGFDPAAILFEFDRLRRDFAPRRKAGQDTAGTLDARTNGGGFPGTDGACSGHVQPVEVCPTLRAGGNETGGHRPPGTDVDTADSLQVVHVAGALCRDSFTGGAGGRPEGAAAGHFLPITMVHGQGGAEIGFDRGPTLTCNHEAPIAVYPSFAIQAGALRTNPNSGPDGVGVQADHAYTLEARAEVQAVCAVALRGREGGATAELGDDLQNCLRASGGGGDKPHVLAPMAFTAKDYGGDAGEISPTLRAMGSADGRPNGGGQVAVQQAMAVRRLTPRECERLQGFPDDYTRIPWRKRPADQCPDGPRYKALGNSWAVPNVRWIGARITLAVAIAEAANTNVPRSKRGVA